MAAVVVLCQVVPVLFELCVVLGQDADLSLHKLYQPAPLENVTVTAKDSNGAVVAETKTDAEGKYCFSLPASTTLSITCSLLGYNDSTFAVSTLLTMVRNLLEVSL